MCAFLGGALAGLMAIPGAANAQSWWEGTWAHDPAWCANAGDIGRATPAPIAITAREIVGYENRCVINSAREMAGIGAVHLQLLCESEGAKSAEERIILRAGPREIHMWFGAGDPVKFTRCETAPGTWLDKG